MNSTRKNQAILKVEALEQRENPSGSPTVYLSPAGVVTINGEDNRNDLVFVNYSYGNQVRIEHLFSPVGRPDVKVEGWTGLFNSSKVKEIIFLGRGGADYIECNVNIPLTAWGGAGNDILIGGSADDNLYGQQGEDTLKGNGGNDGLYGGGGVDRMFGDSGSDRFLIPTTQDQLNPAKHAEIKDFKSEDAALMFVDGKTKTWSQNDIEDMDAAFKVLHKATRNDNLLETPEGGYYVFLREQKNTQHPTFSGATAGDGIIFMYDSAFYTVSEAARTTTHEIAHHWGIAKNIPEFNKFTSISGWTLNPQASIIKQYTLSLGEQGGTWWYKTSAINSFVDRTSKENPNEDWARSWEVYFASKAGWKLPTEFNALAASKANQISALVSRLSR